MWLQKLHSTFRDIIIINVWTNLEPYHLNFQYDRTVSFEKKRTQHQWWVYLQQTEQKFVLKLRYHCLGLVTYRGLAVTSGKIHSILIRTLKCYYLRCERRRCQEFALVNDETRRRGGRQRREALGTIDDAPWHSVFIG